MPAVTVFTGEDVEVPEGSSHEYSCTFQEASGAAIQLAAISDIRGWLDDASSGATINSRANVVLLNTNGGTLADAGGGVGRFTWALDAADAPIVSNSPVARELHRITLKVSYTRSVGGAAQLTHSALYRVVSLDRI